MILICYEGGEDHGKVGMSAKLVLVHSVGVGSIEGWLWAWEELLLQ